MITAEKIEVMQAYVEGLPIEVSSKDENKWVRAVSPIWNWERQDYRIAPNELVRQKILDELALGATVPSIHAHRSFQAGFEAAVERVKNLEL